MKHGPFWSGRFPKGRRPAYPRVRGEHSAQVAIVGGGVTGAACALTFTAAGIDVLLLEADVIGGGLVGGAPGLLREGFAGSFREASSIYGLRVTRGLWETMRRGSLDFAAALRRYKVACELEPQDVITFAARTPDAGQQLRREHEARHAAGIEGSWMTPAALAREAAIESSGGIRTRGFVFDPYRACLGLTAAAEKRGARVHEHSLVRRIRTTRKEVILVCDGATVRADTVVVATGAPIQDLRALRRHLHAEHVYGVVTEPLPPGMRRQLGGRRTVLEDVAGPGRLVRWIADHRVMVHGGRQPQVNERARDRALVQRTGQLMYELSLVYPVISGHLPQSSWDGVDYETVDRLPLLGPHRKFPRHLFAFGSSRHGAGLAWTAARLALRHLHGAPAAADPSLGFPRIL